MTKNLTIISINAKGLSTHYKFKSLLSKLSTQHPSIILIQESFTLSHLPPSDFFISLLKSSWKGHFFFSKHLITLISSHFSASHILTSPDERIMDIKVHTQSSTFILRNIYAPADSSSNSLFWSNFPPLSSSLPYIVGGDFNTTVHLRDRNSSSEHTSPPNLNLLPSHFPNLIDFAGSLPGPPKFTFFCTRLNHFTKSRIDFILLPPSLLFSSSSSYTFSVGSLSDHYAVVFKSHTPIPHSQWRMNTSLLSLPYVQQNINTIFSSYSPPSSPKDWDSCKDNIKQYLKSISLSHSKKRKSSIINLTNRISKLEHSKNPDPILLSRLKHSLSRLEHQSLISLMIRSRTSWYESGETSSTYFFKRYKSRQTSMTIDSLYINSTSSSPTLSNNTSQILQHCTSHFSSLWSSPLSLPLSSPLFNYIPHLSSSSISSLDAPITPQEFYDAIKTKEDHSSPGPDGIPYKFYKLFPTQSASILIPIFKMISTGSSPPSSWAQTITILIHKKNSDPKYVSNLRPITLSNTDIKLLSTILSNCFQQYAHSLIHPFQSGFMKNRNIYDTVLDINSYLTHPNPPPESFVLSIDWSKAYDRVSHSWLDYILQHSLFPPSFIYLSFCTYHNRLTSIKINNTIGTPFPVLQGVPQGDPFAPLLFNLSIQPLFNLISSTPTMTFRAYADDTSIIGHFASDLLLLLDNILPIYQSTAGGQINLLKSSLYPLSPLTFPSIPNSPPTSSSLSILGFNLPINNSNSESLWSSLQLKLLNRSHSLQSRNLSIKGRVLILNSFLLSKLWYYVPICPPPPHSIKSIQTIINNFIWNSSKTHPAFQTSILPPSAGGISLPNFKLECKIRSAKLFSQSFSPNPPFWAKQLNQFTIHKFSQSIPSCVYNRRSTHIPIEPLHSFLNASSLIENLAPHTIPSLPTLPQLRSILLIPPSPPLIPYSPSSHISHLSWTEIHHSHYPRKTQDLLWKIAHQALPIGIKISKISPHSGFCPWCPTIPNSLSHMFHSCPFTSSLWSYALSFTHLITPHSSPSTNILSNSHNKIKHLSRLIISSVIWTVWTSYCSTSFSSSYSPPSSSNQSLHSLISILLSYKSITPQLPWPSISAMTSLIPSPSSL